MIFYHENRKTFQTILITGGAGYIGSHCAVDLLEAGYNVVAIDNFVNSVGSSQDVLPPPLKGVEKITGKKVHFYYGDLLEKSVIQNIFQKHKIDCVIHFAAYKSVGESFHIPLNYYKNNLISTINLLEVMEEYGCYQMVFSSSCSVYGNPATLPITTKSPTGNATSTYGRTKYTSECILRDLSHAKSEWNIIALRYFNPAGAHNSGIIGEHPTKVAYANLMPFLGQVAIGERQHLTVYGNDYNTVDGTGVRDYIHIMDLCSGHLAALKKIESEHLKFKPYNLGIGKGLSVLELKNAFEEVNNVKIPHVILPRREGDVDALYCDASDSETELGWKPRFDAKDMCRDYWRWQTMNPKGYLHD
ncbi:UDP-glucose 4-epimerase-like isoform X2 [Artemia franciscana]|uniref:UDP-glucose 4-epimerase n=1 Tax=Artemia franciscana TaxID=6661 RepID=A0AA88I0E9_ARTSF|nr:hypothetical protein QYM36_004925 [Artemia franciscana]